MGRTAPDPVTIVLLRLHSEVLGHVVSYSFLSYLIPYTLFSLSGSMLLAPIFAIVIAVAHSLNAFGALYVRSYSPNYFRSSNALIRSSTLHHRPYAMADNPVL